MKDWATLEPDEVKLLPHKHHYSEGRGGAEIEFVVIHHNGGVNSVQGVWDIWQYRAASAHYQVESNGWIGQLVWDRDTAWHAASSWANARSIGIEVSNSGGPPDWPVTDVAVEETAHLVAAICLFYELGRPESGTNVRYHSDFHATECPAALGPGGRYNNTLITRAQFWYDQMLTPEEDLLSALSPEEQRELLDNSRVIRRELTQPLPSRSAYRLDDEPVDNLIGMVLNIDGRVHEDWVHARAKEQGTTPDEYANRLNRGR